MTARKQTARGRTVRHALRRILDVAGVATGLLQLHERRMRRQHTILMYHRVLPTEACLEYPLQSLVMPLPVFQEQMLWLSRHCDVLPVRDALARAGEQRTPERPIVSVTFDDGYDDNFVHAAPVLNGLSLKATFFVTTDFVQQGRLLWYDRAAELWDGTSEAGKSMLREEVRRRIESAAGAPPVSVDENLRDIQDWMQALKSLPVSVRDEILAAGALMPEAQADSSRYNPMKADELRELMRNGHEVASHSVTHPILTEVSDPDLEVELRTSKSTLEGWLGAPVRGFCYPNGNHDERVVEMVRSAGYDYACSTESGSNEPTQSPYRLKRRSITMARTMRHDNRGDLLGFRGEVAGLRDRFR